SRNDSSAIVFCHLLIDNIDPLVLPTLVVIHGSTAVIRHQDLSDTAKVLIHVDMCSNPRWLLFVHECFHIWILAVSHYSYENVGVQDLASIRINDMCRISSPIYLNLLCRFAVDMHGSTALLLILLDVIAELGIHKRLISGEAAFLKVLCPEEFLVHAIAEKFLPDISVIRHPLS